MKLLHIYPWLPVLVIAALTASTVIVRCLMLLVGLLAVFSRIPMVDRADAFREFARATHYPSPEHPDDVQALNRHRVADGSRTNER
jgi:hypothetical protein